MTQYLSQGSLALLILRAFLWGVVLGTVYSVFGIRRAAFRKLRIPRVIGATLLHIEDFLFCVMGAVGLTVLYFATTRGVLRVMAIPVLGMGILAWRLTGGRLVEICTDAILRLLARICRWILRHILAPIGCALQKFCRRMYAVIAAYRERQYNRKLIRISKKVTLRYSVALSAACKVGTLPEFDGRVRRGKSRSPSAHRSKRKRKDRPNEK